jgi:hypothetical protein
VTPEFFGSPNSRPQRWSETRQGEHGSANEAITWCHRNGWIHPFFPDQRHQTGALYAFPSPLHAACLSWRLTPTNNIPNFDSILQLSLTVISAFKPSQLNLPIRRVGAQSTDTPPEAQYQDEFYRSLFLITHGNVRISPEFASAKKARVVGRIDFFIPSVNWGIEITRDGNRLNGHNSRFKAKGAYGAWQRSGDMADYILLDCRRVVPKQAHPSMIFWLLASACTDPFSRYSKLGSRCVW